MGPGGINVELWTLFSIEVLSIVTYSLVVDVREQLPSNENRSPDQYNFSLVCSSPYCLR